MLLEKVFHLLECTYFWILIWKMESLLSGCAVLGSGSVWTSSWLLNSSFLNEIWSSLLFLSSFLSMLLLPLLFLQFLKVYHLCFEILQKPSVKCSKYFMKRLNYPPSVFLDFHKLPLIKEEWYWFWKQRSDMHKQTTK